MFEQTSIASGQRETKRQPAGGSTAAEASPLRTSIRFASRPASGSAAAESSSRVYGWSGSASTSSIGPCSTIWPGVHHENVVGDVARTRKIVRDVEERDLPLLLELEHQVQDPDANRDVEHARRLVRQEHHRLDSQRSRDCDSLALSAGELVGVLVRHMRGRHETDGAQQLVHTVFDLVAIDDAVDSKRTLEVVPDRLHRIERAEWILEDHLHLRPVAEHRPPAPVARDVATAVDDASRSRRIQARDQSCHRALAAAALADECGDLSGTEREADIVDRVHVASPAHQRRRRRGSASRDCEPRAPLRSCVSLRRDDMRRDGRDRPGGATDAPPSGACTSRAVPGRRAGSGGGTCTPPGDRRGRGASPECRPAGASAPSAEGTTP